MPAHGFVIAVHLPGSRWHQHAHPSLKSVEGVGAASHVTPSSRSGADGSTELSRPGVYLRDMHPGIDADVVPRQVAPWDQSSPHPGVSVRAMVIHHQVRIQLSWITVLIGPSRSGAGTPGPAWPLERLGPGVHLSAGHVQGATRLVVPWRMSSWVIAVKAWGSCRAGAAALRPSLSRGNQGTWWQGGADRPVRRPARSVPAERSIGQGPGSIQALESADLITGVLQRHLAAIGRHATTPQGVS
jgi:hypothetical protein